jgi:hypothetical protein
MKCLLNRLELGESRVEELQNGANYERYKIYKESAFARCLSPVSLFCFSMGKYC